MSKDARPFAVVTGSTRNIGRAIVVELARRGFDVGVNGRAATYDMAELQAQAAAFGATLRYFGGSVDEPDAIAAIFSRIESEVGRLDVLVNNASQRREVSFEEMTLDEWRSIVHVQLDSLFLCCKAALVLLKNSQRGRIVNIGGLSAHIGAKSRAHVVTTKAGVVGFSRALARDLADRAITVNAVVPGRIDTSRTSPAPDVGKAAAGERLGRPEEVAVAVALLCEREAAYITGQAIHVNGGAYLSG